MNHERMMKKCWLNEATEGLHSLSLESENVDLNEPWEMISAISNTYPVEHTSEHPLRHIIVLAYLKDDDLIELHNEIRKYLYQKGVIE